MLTTSLRCWAAAADTIEMLAVSEEGAWLVQTPMLALEVKGAGGMRRQRCSWRTCCGKYPGGGAVDDGFDRLRRAGRDAQDGLERDASRLRAGKRRRAASAVRSKADPLGHVRGERLDLRRWQPERG